MWLENMLWRGASQMTVVHIQCRSLRAVNQGLWLLHSACNVALYTLAIHIMFQPEPDMRQVTASVGLLSLPRWKWKNLAKLVFVLLPTMETIFSFIRRTVFHYRCCVRCDNYREAFATIASCRFSVAAVRCARWSVSWMRPAGPSNCRRSRGTHTTPVCLWTTLCSNSTPLFTLTIWFNF